jgi:hypothetical protein
MKKFKGPTTTFAVLKALEWHEAPDNVTLPPGSYPAIPTMVRDSVNGIDSVLEWTINSHGRAFVMGGTQAYYFARDGLVQVEGWSTERLRS